MAAGTHRPPDDPIFVSIPSPASTPPDERPVPRWGLGEVALAALASMAIYLVLGGIIMALAGVEGPDDTSLVVVALVQATLWVGMVGSVLLLVRARGGRIAEELGLRVRPIDVPLGLALGVACQLALVPVISAPWIRILGEDGDKLREPACRLADKADDPVGVALFFLIAVIGAPIVEELFFRGFVQRAAVARLGRGLGLVTTAVIFGLVHFQLLQLPALVAFGLVLGLLAERTGRLGPSILAHMGFNATTVIALVALSSDSRCDEVLGLVLP